MTNLATPASTSQDRRLVVRQQLELLTELVDGLIHSEGASTSEHYHANCDLLSTAQHILALSECDWFGPFERLTLAWIDEQRYDLEWQYRCREEP